MRTHRLFLISAALLLAGLACNVGAVLSPGTPTSLPPTAIPLLPTATIPPDPKLESIFISQPGSNSSITSPVTVSGEADSTFEQNLVVMVTGEDGAQLALAPTTIQAPLGQRGAFSLELAFAVAAEQPGRVSVFSTNAMTGGIDHLASVEVTLLPSGSASPSSNPPAPESIAISSPLHSAVVSGGSIAVSGFSDYYFESSLGLALCGGGASGDADDLCGTTGNVLATGTATINAPDIGQPGPFSGSLSYSISAPTSGRLVVYATSPRDGGILHLSSVPLQLQP